MTFKNKKLAITLLIYTILFYSVWSVWRVVLAPHLSIINNEYLSHLIGDGFVKNLIWTLPAVLLIRHFEKDMYVSLKQMFTTKIKWLDHLPTFLVFTAYLLLGQFLQNGKLAISDTFSGSKLIIVLFVGLTEEIVFRGWLLNSTYRSEKSWISIAVNALMFLAIHFPIWISSGTFFSSFTDLGFVCIIVLSCVFSKSFLESKNLLVPIALHMYWDLLGFVFF